MDGERIAVVVPPLGVGASSLRIGTTLEVIGDFDSMERVAVNAGVFF
jgi:hypothetical protein